MPRLSMLTAAALTLTLACCSSRRQEAPAPVPGATSGPSSAAASESGWGYFTPALDEHRGLAIEIARAGVSSIGELVIDGHATGQPWSVSHPPRVDATGDGRYLLYGQVGATASDWELFLWEPDGRRLTGFGDVARASVPPLGAVFTRSAAAGGVAALYELSRTAPRLVPIWEAGDGVASIMGAHEGALVLLERDRGRAWITRVRDGAPPSRTQVELGGRAPLPLVPSAGLDGGRLLLTRMIVERSAGALNFPPRDPGVWELASLDIGTGALRVLGDAPGSWTPTGISRAAPPLVVFVDGHEGPDADALKPHGSCVTTVARGDLSLRTRCPPGGPSFGS